MRERGQASIEFMLILIVMLIYIQTVILPTSTVSLYSVEDVALVGQTSFAAKKLANAIQNIQLLPGDARQQISLFVPECGAMDCNVTCNGTEKKITFSAPLNPDLNEHADCPGKICTKDITVSGTVVCNPDNFILTGPTGRTPGNLGLITINWNKGSETVSVTSS